MLRSYGEPISLPAKRIHVELRKRSFANISPDFSVSQSNGIVSKLAHLLYGIAYLEDRSEDMQSIYTRVAEISREERNSVIITDGHQSTLGEIKYLPVQVFSDGDYQRRAARVAATLEFPPETITFDSYEHIRNIVENHWPQHLSFAKKVQNPAP